MMPDTVKQPPVSFIFQLSPHEERGVLDCSLCVSSVPPYKLQDFLSTWSWLANDFQLDMHNSPTFDTVNVYEIKMSLNE